MKLQPQKVLHLKDALKLKTPKLHGEYLITEKYDGWWVAIPYSLGDGWLAPISSAGRTIPSLKWTIPTLNQLLSKPHEPCYLIAEAVIPDTPFEIINGKLNRSVGECDCTDVQLILHNVVFPKSPTINALDRWNMLRHLNISNTRLMLKAPLLYAGPYDHRMWMKYFDQVTGKDGEGIVAQRTTALYDPGKRNADLLKMKLECTIDALAVALEEGVGEQGFPSLTLVSQRKNEVKIRTVIGKHADQKLFRENPSSVIGKVVEIKAMEELEDGQLRQPVFRFIRHDKLPTEID